jgi:hypothetical protein
MAEWYGQPSFLNEINIMKKRLFDFEARHQPLLSRAAFFRRLARHFLASVLLVGGSLLGGMAGYCYFEGMSWIDAYANAAMILSGLGPLAQLETFGGKLFAGSYALYSGLAVIVAMSLILAPVLHRLLHGFHLQSDKESI